MGKYDLRVVKMALKDCVSPDWNPRVISDGEFEALKHSIRTFGYSDPIVVNQRNNHVVAGNQRLRALRELNVENHGKFGVIDVVLLDLPECDEKAFNIGHNRIGGEFDEDALELLLDELGDLGYDLSLTGFEDVLVGDDEDLDEFLDDEGEDDDSLLGGDFGEVEYVISVRCADSGQQDSLFRELRERGYRVKATQY